MPLELHDIPDAPAAIQPDQGNMRAQANGQAKVAPNLKDALRKKFENLEKTRVGDFDVPGYDGLLVARYRRMTTEEVVKLGEGIPEGGISDTRAAARVSALLNADFLGAACQELLARNEDGQLVSLGEDYPIRYDLQFAQMMGFDVTPEEGVREVVLRIFDHNELALKRHADEVDEWMTSMSVHSSGDAAGK